MNPIHKVLTGAWKPVRRSSRNVDTYGCPVFVLPVRLICTIVAKWYLLVWLLVFNCVLWSVTLAWCFYCKSSKEEVCGAVEGSSWPQWRSEMVGERRQPQFEWHSFNTRAHRCSLQCWWKACCRWFFCHMVWFLSCPLPKGKNKTIQIRLCLHPHLIVIATKSHNC